MWKEERRKENRLGMYVMDGKEWADQLSMIEMECSTDFWCEQEPFGQGVMNTDAF